RVQELLNRAVDKRRRDELSGWQRLNTRVFVLIALIPLIVLIALIVAGLLTALLIGGICVGAEIGTRRQSQQCRRCDCASLEQLLQRSVHHGESFRILGRSSHLVLSWLVEHNRCRKVREPCDNVPISQKSRSNVFVMRTR